MPLETTGSGFEACGQHGTRCCCFGSLFRSCRDSPNAGSSVCCSRNRHAARIVRGTLRLAKRIISSVPKDGMAQSPCICMFRVRNPRGYTLPDPVACNPADSAILLQHPQPSAESPHIVLRQSPAAIRQQDKSEKHRILIRGNDECLSRMEQQPALF